MALSRPTRPRATSARTASSSASAAHRTETFGNIAHRWSVYESRHAAEDAVPFQRGINSIQLLKDGDRWWVVSIFCDNERPGSSTPEEYQRDRP